MTLTARLLLSYLIIIFVSLTLAFGTLILVARPAQNRLARLRLTAESRQAASLVNGLYRQGLSTETVLARFKVAAAEQESRLLFLDPQGQVLADSRGAWVGQQLPLPASADDPSLSLREIEPQNFVAPNGDEFSYIPIPVGPAENRAGYIAAVGPRLSGLLGVLSELSRGFLAAGGVAVLVSLLLGGFIARSIALPLQQMAAAAGAVAAGDYEHRLPETGPPEIKRVAHSFNVMIGRVESSQRAMRDFVSNVSHELKTPLTSIQGFSQAIMEGATYDEPARKRAAGIIHQEAGRMARLVEDLLDLARIDSGQIVMKKAQLDLGQILTSTVERLLPQAAQQQIRLIKKWNTLPPMVGDGDRLAQVFTNLLDNAVRHTPAGGQVTITGQTAKGLPRPRRVQAGQVQPDATTALSERGDFVEVSIADSGPGIPAQDLARIFERFYQVDKSRKRGKGTGLGLTITKEIVEAHGGYIRAESAAGEGTKFTVFLPITEADVATVISPRRYTQRISKFP
ncbi:MAG: ATP-binding protein [Anaerolineae bacterium]